MNNPIILEAQDLYKNLSNGEKVFPILHKINLQIEEGEWVSLVGPSGSGKTTLLGLLSGIDRPSKGRVNLDGQEISSLSEGKLAKVRNRKVGVVFQQFFLLNNLTALENVCAPLYIRRDIKNITAKATEMLGWVGLGNRLNNLPHQLSGGEQQRVAIARALVTEPKVLFADEPTGNLDAATGNQVLEMLKDLRKTLGLSLVMVTHDSRIAAMADRQLHLYDGRLVENMVLNASSSQFHAEPINPSVNQVRS
ncbi:MAG: ABC transporter ATP-binding protein [Anaerolineaceae bacterium]|nr:ABC transporter ATP-binding protein [Anaerolineaceae bacterium]